jgi:hypothetical protein
MCSHWKAAGTGNGEGGEGDEDDEDEHDNDNEAARQHNKRQSGQRGMDGEQATGNGSEGNGMAGTPAMEEVQQQSTSVVGEIAP